MEKKDSSHTSTLISKHKLRNLKDSKKIPLKKVNEGNSQFVRSKLDSQYKPALRVFIENRSPFNEAQFEEKKNAERVRKQEEIKLFYRAKEEVKKGKKIVIDWSTKTNFRTTRFPDLNERSLNSIRVRTQILNSKETSAHQSPSFFNEQIQIKCEHLKQLISNGVIEKRKHSRKKENKKCRTEFSEMSQPAYSINTPNHRLAHNESTSQDNEMKNSRNIYSYMSSCRNSLIENLAQKQKMYYLIHREEIKKAMQHEMNMSIPLVQQIKQTKKKTRIQSIQERIIEKSKLTLLKSDLIKKFKQIQESCLEEAENRVKKN